ncbi:MAG: peptidase U35, partial [Alphaproteobacteria bacterium]|nr:peptidase U35 [Alphaproteobacteria bacterium]
ATIKGKTYQGPLKVAQKWTLKEISAVPIGADQDAKSRGIPKKEGGKGIMKINEKLRAILVARGLPEDATDEEVLAFMEKLTLPDERKESRETKTVIETKTDEDHIREAIAAERGRVQEIKAMCQRFQCDLADDLIADGTSLEEARKAVMDRVAKTMETAGGAGYRPPAEMLRDERDKFRAAAQEALIIRTGLPGLSVETPIPGARELAGYSLRELAREALVRANQRPDGNVLEMVGRALTVSDFPYILANVANKALFAGWETNEETWQAWCATGQVSDFKTNYSPRVSESSDLEEVPESAEYRYGKRTEAQESYSIATYGKLFAISRQTIINDDLGALTNIPQSHGEAAARKIGDIVYAVLTANAAMGDNIALFDASHSNLAASGAVPGITTIAAGILAMGTQKDLQALRRLNIRPQFYIAPKALEGSSEVLFRSTAFVDTNTIATDSSLAATRVNPYAGDYFTRVYDPRLDDVSATAWYLAARKGRTVVLYFLNGIQTPYMETKQGWSVDGVEYKVRID